MIIISSMSKGDYGGTDNVLLSDYGDESQKCRWLKRMGRGVLEIEDVGQSNIQGGSL